jgi:gamma-glutamyltranspeptidase/glutathione hydrolase
MVASGHHLASLAGMRVLQEGGNAVDAALATSFTLAVVKPDACGVGGDLFALVYMQDKGRVEALNASGPAPGRATVEMFRDQGLSQIPTDGPLSIAIPGAVDGWVELHRKHGTLDLSRLAADAIGYAREGFPLSRHLGEKIASLSSSFPGVDRSFRESLGDLRLGRMLVQTELTDTLKQIVEKGREGFYRGEVGERMCHAIQAEGGVLSEADLHGNFAEWLEPITTTYREHLVFEQPPVSQGFMVLEMLNIIEGYSLEKMELTDLVHVMVEAKKLAFEDRVNHLEDPRFGDPEISRLISKEHARKRRRLISDGPQSRDHTDGTFGSDTTYLCTADRQGNVVSLIQSIFAPFGSGVVAGDTGMVMNNRLCSFVLDPSKANALRPGKRPAHTLNSYMIFRDGEFLLVGGTPGADDQPQTNVQVIHNLIDRHMDPQTAVELPRWSHRPGTPPHLEEPEELSMEEGFAAELIDGLGKKGHKVKVVDRWSFGSAEVIVRDPITRAYLAGADPRREGYAIGW